MESVKSVLKKTVDSKCINFIKNLFSKENLYKYVGVIKTATVKTVSKLRLEVKNLLDIFIDRFKATNLYAYSKRGIEKYKSSSIGIKAASVCAAIVLVLFIGFVSSGATIAYDINYKGQVIGTVGNKKMCVAAVNLALKEVGDDAGSEISTPKYKLVLTFKNRLATKQDLKDAILENTNSISYATLLKVDGKEIVYIKDGDLEAYLKDYCDSFNIEGAESSSAFVETVEVQTGYFNTDKVYTLEKAKELINSSLTVKTEATVLNEQQIAFGTTTTTTSSQLLGYSKVIAAGIYGTRLNTDDVVLVNGVEIERTNISSVVTKNPTNQVVMVGTAKTLASASQRAEASSYGFIFPLDKSSKWKVSSYYGDGRNHKGVDICAPYKTKIYSVAAGTVTYAGYRSDYGYLVVIDHGNGLSTAYAHASVLGVKKGDKVKAGETIALVGSTGNSTGNHLHFEVRKGETKVDPSPYIGLA